MTQEEYAKLMGYGVHYIYRDKTGENNEFSEKFKKEYVEVNAVYENSGLDKELFCADWKRYGDSEIIRSLNCKVCELRRLVEKQREDIQTLLDNTTDMLGELYETRITEEDVNKYLAELQNFLSTSDIIKFKMFHGIDLENNERQYVIDNL